MPNGYRRGGQVTRGGRSFYRRGARIEVGQQLRTLHRMVGVLALVSVSATVAAPSLAMVGCSAFLVGWWGAAWLVRHPHARRRLAQPVVRWADRRMSRRNTRPVVLARTPKTFDVFDPVTGRTTKQTHSEWQAKRLTKGNGLDYAPEGEGW